jgi:hypothetical protein
MVFIPVVAQQAAPPSARALDLARRLKEEIDKFERQYPGTSREDLRAAAAIAIGEESVTVPPRRKAAAAIVGVITAMGILGLVMELATRKASGSASAPWSFMVVAIVIAGVGVVAAVLRRTRQ